VNKTLSAVEVHERIEREGKKKAVQEVRYIERMKVGQVFRQGDIYFHRVAASHPHGKKLSSNQLAVGDTQGARHTAAAPAEVYEGTTLPEWCSPGTFLGPCVISTQRFRAPHPEHAHGSLPKGSYQITHQMDAATLRRVMD